MELDLKVKNFLQVLLLKRRRSTDKAEAIKAGVVDRLIQAKLTKKGTALQSEIISILRDSGALFQNLFTKASFLSVSLTLVCR